MKKLIIFGDSFANYDWKPELIEKTWGASLGNLLKLPVINYGVSGSALAFSLNKFVEYYQSDSYSSEDIIVFVLTSPDRLWVKSMEDRLCFGNIAHAVDNPHLKNDLWFKKNGDSALWTVLNIYDTKINYELIKILSFLQIWSATNLHNRLVVLRAFPNEDLSKEAVAIEKLTKLITPTNNFFPIIHGPALGHLVAHEFKEFKGWGDGPDIRVNHMSPVNREILSQMLHDVILYRDISKYNVSLFKKHLYNDHIPGYEFIFNPPDSGFI
jgi:hypothetical protein